ncbi:coiled-coil domain-containing protein 93 [Capsicum galapagoense]
MKYWWFLVPLVVYNLQEEPFGSVEYSDCTLYYNTVIIIIIIMEEVKKDDFPSEIKKLQQRVDGDPIAQRMLSLLETSKVLDRKESDLQSRCILEHAKLQTKVDEFEELLQRGKEGKLSESLDQTFWDSTEKLDSAKRELAANLRSTLSFKRHLDDLPSQAELIQYELRFSELYTHIQAKDRQTRNYYATYNTLLEMKELMLKETSLLNSICSQFKDALTSPAGRKKLIDSMEGILLGTQRVSILILEMHLY